MASIKKHDYPAYAPSHLHRIQPGKELCNYIVERIDDLASIDAVMVQLVHRGTGARHIHIAAPDTENTFSVLFRTIPEDSTGVAHILEHTVLCGSQKFRVKDPFFSMLKRSLSSFMNAFTASDWTMYPFATQNRKDYFNLMDVYLDAVFFPRLDIMSFKQEGHRVETVLSSETGTVELAYKGVVYNEMKGAMSSPSQVMGRALLKALYPSTTYSNNSGGDPACIPSLTHDDLKAFHARYYHPSNAFFYTYGSFDLEPTLSFIDQKVLSGFNRLSVDTLVPQQPRWDKPRTAQASYSFSKQDSPEKKYQACVAWLTCDIRDEFEVLVLMVIEQILLGNAGSPLRKALIDAGIGSALSDGSGFDPDNRDTMFAVGLKDITKDDARKVESIVFETLNHLVENKIPGKLIESAIHQIEFYRKEKTNTPQPYGIKLALTISSTLVHEGDPASCLNIDDDLDRLKSRIEQGPFLEKRIVRYFLENPHRVLFTLVPDQTLEEKEGRREKKQLEDLLKTLSGDDLAALEKDALELARLQESQEDVSSLPTLEVSDISPEIEIIRPNVMDSLSITTGYEQPTSGILYLTCPAGIHDLPSSLLPLVPFFCNAFINAGTGDRDFARMAELVDLYTGGVSASPYCGSFHGDLDGCHAFVSIQGKALDRNVDRLLDLLTSFILKYRFADTDRLKQLLYQHQAALESSIVASGHIYAISLASRNLSISARINENWHGISQYHYIRQLVKDIENAKTRAQNMERLCSDLTLIAKGICRRNNVMPAAVGNKTSIQAADRHMTAIEHQLQGQGTHEFPVPDITVEKKFPFDGWYTNTAVSFVAQSFKTVSISHPDAPALAIMSKLLRTLYLHREIREKGGAYGGFASYNYDEGIFSFGSYRDPHITRTLDVYRKACDFIVSGTYTKTDVKEAVLQVCSDIDKPETPGPASIKAFYRTITGLTDEMRHEFKDRLLQITRADIINAAATYFPSDDTRKGTAVISSREKLEEAGRQLEKTSRPLALRQI